MTTENHEHSHEHEHGHGTPPDDYRQHHTDVTHPNPGQREFDDISEAWSGNIKRTYDEYQHESLESIRRNRTYIDKVLSDAQQNDQTRQNIANQSLQNAVETANMVAKQHLRHNDLAIDRQWNIDEIAQLVSKTPVLLDAISAAVAKAVQDKPAPGS